MHKTTEEFQQIIQICRSLFLKKLTDYGTAWRILRPTSVTDQLYIKIKRLITLQNYDIQMIEDESEEDSFIGIINYAIIGLIQLEIGPSENLIENTDKTMGFYDRFSHEAQLLMEKKNHDYGEAWREMRISSITDLIYQKILRTKQIEDNNGKTIISEGISANYFDMLNYAVFCMIKLKNS